MLEIEEYKKKHKKYKKKDVESVKKSQKEVESEKFEVVELEKIDGDESPGNNENQEESFVIKKVESGVDNKKIKLTETRKDKITGGDKPMV